MIEESRKRASKTTKERHGKEFLKERAKKGGVASNRALREKYGDKWMSERGKRMAAARYKNNKNKHV